MAPLPKRIRIVVGGVQLDAELKHTKTAEQLYAVLPYEAPVHAWGEEFYCHVPAVTDYRETATTKVQVGDIAYWGIGRVLAIFFGRTPMSISDDPVPADRVNVIGRIVGDATVLRRALGAATIRLDRIEG